MPRERLIFHPDRINGRNVYDYIHADEDSQIDQGVDSHVYRFDKWIVHQFFKIPLRKVLALQRVTDEVARYAPEYSGTIGLWGHIALRVAPMIKVFESHKYHQAFAVERYVTGFRPREKQNRRLDEFLNDFSSDMRTRTGVRCIQVISPNTKLQKVNKGIAVFAKSTCTITDLCQYMDDFSG